MQYKGLTNQQAQALLKKNGPNTITHTDKTNTFQLLINQLKSPLIYILLVAATISLALNAPRDAIFILIVVIINTLLGFFQEYKAENTLEKLKNSVSRTIKVYRDNLKIIIDTENLVVGDIIMLEPGLRIPADAILLEATELMIDESVLTGESEPVEKRSANPTETLITKLNPTHTKKYAIFKGTSVVEGLGIAVVKSIGNNTYFGQIAKSLSTKFDPDTPIKIELNKISKVITYTIIGITIVIVTLGLMRGMHFEEIFMTAVALGVSTIPEGLIIALTITLALGMNRIMSQGAIVRNLPAAETLGDIDVLCLDKTGTLTEGNMQVTNVEFINNDQAHKAIILCNNDANFIDKALNEYIKSATTADIHKQMLFQKQGLFPFSSIKKYTGAYDKNSLYAVGAPEVILNFCKNPDHKWQQLIDKHAKLGSRMIAVSIKSITSTPTRADFTSMKFLGLVFVKDPVRKSAGESLKKLNQAGIDVKVITGDLKETSLSVLHALDFDIKQDEIISGKELNEIKNELKFDSIIAKTKLFFRTTPDQKMKIVQSLQRQDKRVGMMGDGVNDAPALRRSEIGITVNNATDISKEVSDVVLLDSNFATIIGAVEEGRNIFQNLRKIMTYLFADSLSETVLILMSLLANMPLPLLPLHLLWINLVEDGLPSLALSFEKSQRNLLLDKPRHKNKSIMDKKSIISIIITSLLLDILYFGIFYKLIDLGYSIVHAQTFMFAGISISSLFFLYSAKTIDTNIWREKLFNNTFLNISVIVGFILTLSAITWPPLMNILTTVYLTKLDFIIILAISLLDVAMVEGVKYWLHKKGH